MASPMTVSDVGEQERAQREPQEGRVQYLRVHVTYMKHVELTAKVV